MPLKFSLALGGTEKPSARPKRAPSFHAVGVQPAADACEAARAAQGRRVLSHEAPMLPLEGCDRPARCACRYQHFDDRRDRPRRQLEGAPPAEGQTAPEAERRATPGRRADDQPDLGFAEDTEPDDLADTYFGFCRKG